MCTFGVHWSWWGKWKNTANGFACTLMSMSSRFRRSTRAILNRHFLTRSDGHGAFIYPCCVHGNIGMVSFWGRWCAERMFQPYHIEVTLEMTAQMITIIETMCRTCVSTMSGHGLTGNLGVKLLFFVSTPVLVNHRRILKWHVTNIEHMKSTTYVSAMLVHCHTWNLVVYKLNIFSTIGVSMHCVDFVRS